MQYVIIGNGAAGVSAAAEIRRLDPHGQITILTAEQSLMYSRPGLAYVATGAISERQVVARTAEWYAEQRLTLIQSAAMAIDPDQQTVTLARGDVLRYDRLLIATGARAVPPPYPGSDLDGIVYLDSLASTRDMIRRARRAKRAVVIGGGITALELCEGLVQRKVETHYFVRRQQLWSKVFNPTEAALLAERMTHHGVHVHYGTEVAALDGDRRGRIKGVTTKAGEFFRCNLLGVAIGVRTNLGVVKPAGLATDRGILVDAYLATNQPNIYAAGDCAQVYDAWSDSHLLDILWPSAVAEGKAAARNMVGYREPYVKGTAFNACLLFGLHVTIIGQVNPRSDAEPDTETVQHLSRGSSEMWFTFPRTYASAWSNKGEGTVRLVFGPEERIVGALIVGEQSLADPLRDLIEGGVDVSAYREPLDAGGDAMRHAIRAAWQATTQQGASA